MTKFKQTEIKPMARKVNSIGLQFTSYMAEQFRFTIEDFDEIYFIKGNELKKLLQAIVVQLKCMFNISVFKRADGLDGAAIYGNL